MLSARHLRAHALGPLRRPGTIKEPARLPQLPIHEDVRLDAVLAVVAEFYAIAIAVLENSNSSSAGFGCRGGAGDWCGA